MYNLLNSIRLFDEEIDMASTAFNNLVEQVDMLSYTDRLRLLERIANTLQTRDLPVSTDNSVAFDRAFGLWQSRDISLDSIRQKAWGRDQ